MLNIAQQISQNGEEHPATKDTQNLMGWRTKGKLHEKRAESFIEHKEELAEIMEYRRVNRLGGQNRRAAILLGMFQKDCQIKASIPSNDRSRFSQERYQFMLDAPFEISSMCCNVMKKAPVHKYQKDFGLQPITAQLASESRLRSQKWLKSGCNGFDLKRPISNPMSFWTEQDVLLYIYTHKIPIASVYGEIVKDKEIDGQVDLEDLGLFELELPTLKTTGCDRTGCFACLYGAHHEKKKEDSRIQKTIDFSNPKLADWELRGGRFNEKGLWEPYKGLGYWFIILWINKYGNFNMWFPNKEYYVEKYSTPETDMYLK